MRVFGNAVEIALFAALVFPWGNPLAALNEPPPPPFREFRGAWVATVSNIDWPSKPGLPAAKQQEELIRLLDRAVHLKLNAIILQVRPACDALYPSKIEPWSEYLTGEQGRPPTPLYDPLAFAVRQAHLRGLELHAWFNPFRSRDPSSRSPVSRMHVSRRFPQVVRKYGSYLWLDPGEPFAANYSKTVILDVVKRYDIDGVHLDDYFYPYAKKDERNRLISFPDDPSWERYRSANGKLNRNDWRRKNVDDFVQSLYRGIKKEKPWVKFGMSPFGIWRPGNPPQIVGKDAYEEIFADSRKWIINGWADYFAPQLYWRIQPPKQSFPALLRWWADQNRQKRHLWPGMNSERVGAGIWPAGEVLNQIQRTRIQPGATGHIHWNMSGLINERGELGSALLKNAYVEPALIPASTWLDSKAPEKPRVYVERFPSTRRFRIRWENGGSEPTGLWVVQYRTAGRWTTEILPGKHSNRMFDSNDGRPAPDIVSVLAVDRCGNAGPARILDNPSGESSRR